MTTARQKRATPSKPCILILPFILSPELLERAHPLDGLLVQQCPGDLRRTFKGPLYGDDPARGDDEVHGDVLLLHRHHLTHLEVIHQCDNGGPFVDRADLPQDHVFQIEVPASLSDPPPLEIHGHSTGGQQIYCTYFLASSGEALAEPPDAGAAGRPFPVLDLNPLLFQQIEAIPQTWGGPD